MWVGEEDSEEKHKADSWILGGEILVQCTKDQCG